MIKYTPIVKHWAEIATLGLQYGINTIVQKCLASERLFKLIGSKFRFTNTIIFLENNPIKIWTN